MGYFLQDLTGKQIPIGLSMQIGSDTECQIVLTDDQVSAVHAILGEFPDGLLIRDENNASGTFVNNQKIEHVTALKPGDQIRFGNALFIVGSTEPVAFKLPAAPPPVPAAILPPDKPQTAMSGGMATLLPDPQVAPPPPVTIVPPAATQAIPPPLPPPEKQKKSGGCLKWGLTIFLVMILACVVVVGGGYLLLRAGIIPQRMIDNAMGNGQAQIAIYNFTDKPAYIRIQEKFEDENTVTMPQIYWDLAPYDLKTELSFTGTNSREIMTIGTTKDGNELGTCIFVARQTDDFNIVILRDKVLIDNVQYPESTDKPPASGKDLILATSSICE